MTMQGLLDVAGQKMASFAKAVSSRHPSDMTSATQISQASVRFVTLPNSLAQPVAQVLFMIPLPPHSYLCLALQSQQLPL